MTCTCGNPMAREHDRYRCYICGRSHWRSFTMRQPGVKDTKGNTGHNKNTIKGYGKEVWP